MNQYAFIIKTLNDCRINNDDFNLVDQLSTVQNTSDLTRVKKKKRKEKKKIQNIKDNYIVSSKCQPGLGYIKSLYETNR